MKENATPPDVWEGWKPAWDGAAPHAQQEAHSPTLPVPERSAGMERARKAGIPASAADVPPQARRRLADARLWDSLPPQHQDAALEIACAFENMGRGLGYITSNWERIPGGGAVAAAFCNERLVRNYIAWTERCKEARVSHSMIVDVLVFGFSCRALDRDRGAHRGQARRNLAAGLDVYCRMKGWPCAG